MLLLLLNYVVLRALWKIDEHLISTLVNKSLYYYYCAPATQRQTFCAKLHTAQNLKIHLGRYCGPVCIQKHFDHFDHFCIEFWPQLQYNGTSFSSPGSEHASDILHVDINTWLEKCAKVVSIYVMMVQFLQWQIDTWFTDVHEYVRPITYAVTSLDKQNIYLPTSHDFTRF